MNVSKLVVAMGLGMALVSGAAMAEDAAPAAPADQGHGTVKFTGSIIDAPCSIAPGENGEQVVDLGEVSKKLMENGGTSTPKNFEIKLEQCDISDGKSNVTATFTGAASSLNGDLLGITGTAKGASIAITDGSGQLIKLGSPSPAQKLQNGNNTLEFSAYLQGSTTSGTEVVPGSFTSVADFTLAYQ